MSKKDSPSKKKLAEKFLNLTEKGEVDKAFELYVADSFKHHNPRFKGDRDTMKEVMNKTAKQFANLTSTRYAMLEDGDFVAIHSHIQPSPDNKRDAGLSYVHIFRFDGERIVELWDVGQTVPLKTINENGMF